jgi:hypothetical protein
METVSQNSQAIWHRQDLEQICMVGSLVVSPHRTPVNATQIHQSNLTINMSLP